MAHPRDTLHQPQRPSGPNRSTLFSPTRFLTTAVALLAMACAGDSSVDPVEVRNLTLALEPTKLFLAEGQVGQLHAKLIDDAGNPVPAKDLSWTTSDPQVATVTDAGVVTGLASGVVSITASSKGKKQDADVNVRGKGKLEIYLSSGSGQSGPVGETLDQALVVEVRDRTGAGIAGVEVNWQATGGDGSPSAPTTTTNQNGLTQVLWTLGPTLGDQTLQAKVSGAGTVDFPATGTPGAPASVTVSPDDVSMDVGNKQQFSAVVADQFGHPVEAGSIIWVSTAGDILYVDDAGLATAMSPGSAVVEAYVETVSGSANVEVTGTPEVSTVAVSPETHTFTALGQTLQLAAVAHDGSGEPLTGINFNWSSTDPSIATVDDMGLVLAKAVGTVSMIVSAVCCDGATDTASLVITQVPAVVEVSPATFVLDVNQTAALTAEVRDSEGNPMTYAPSWTSSDPLVATVDGQGVVTALTSGLVTIQAQAGDASGTTDGEIADANLDAEPVPAAIEVSPATFSLDVGQSQQLDATVLGSDGEVMEGEEVTWSSLDPTVASITTGGLVSALAEGSAQFEARLASSSSSTSSSNYEPAEVQSGPSAWSNGSSASSSSELVGVSSGTMQATEDDGGDTGGGSGDGLLFSDGFESGDLSGSTNGFSWDAHGGNVQVVSAADMIGTSPKSDNHSLQFFYKASDQISAELRFSFPNTPYLALEYDLYWPANWIHNDPGGATNNKFNVVWMDTYEGTFKVTTSYIRTTDGNSKHDMLAVQTGGATTENNPDPLVSSSGPIVPGEWNQIRLVHRTASGLGKKDGLYQMWVNGTVVSELSEFEFWNIAGAPTTYMNRGYLFGAANSGMDKDYYFYIDNFNVHTSDPGW